MSFFAVSRQGKSSKSAIIRKRARRVYNILRFGLSDEGRARKRAAKKAAKLAAFESERWSRDSKFARRSYGTYAEYLQSQVGEFDKIAWRLQENHEEDLAEFRRRFEGCTALAETPCVLCLGARYGTEVQALLELGHFAVGIDLNPGSGNPYVLNGDFHNLVFADASTDAVYCNALDHVHDLDRILGEIGRVLRPGGVFIADMLQGFEEGFIPGDYASMIWRNREEFAREIAERSGFELVGIRDLGEYRRDPWAQAVFRKGAKA